MCNCKKVVHTWQEKHRPIGLHVYSSTWFFFFKHFQLGYRAYLAWAYLIFSFLSSQATNHTFFLPFSVSSILSIILWVLQCRGKKLTMLVGKFFACEACELILTNMDKYGLLMPLSWYIITTSEPFTTACADTPILALIINFLFIISDEVQRCTIPRW